jgi:microsomal epoxide hydrolase
VSKLLPLLSRTDDDSPAFHIIAPSLPSFGFSEGPKKVTGSQRSVQNAVVLTIWQKGFGLKQYAQAMNGLMLNLGFDEYGLSQACSLLASCGN